EVVWSWRLKNGSYGRVYPPGTEIKDVPKDLISADAFLIRAGAELSYKPVITWTDTAKKTLGLMAAFDSIEMGESYYLRPRVTRKISCSDC
ncbi:hypothetical protein M8745_19430, partial [Lutimaribacter sp. EGI FJ00014]|nr:hypothetical protein [Lutimaribacter sp. EGI FJ00014]